MTCFVWRITCASSLQHEVAHALLEASKTRTHGMSFLTLSFECIFCMYLLGPYVVCAVLLEVCHNLICQVSKQNSMHSCFWHLHRCSNATKQNGLIKAFDLVKEVITDLLPPCGLHLQLRGTSSCQPVQIPEGCSLWDCHGLLMRTSEGTINLIKVGQRCVVHICGFERPKYLQSTLSFTA